MGLVTPRPLILLGFLLVLPLTLLLIYRQTAFDGPFSGLSALSSSTTSGATAVALGWTQVDAEIEGFEEIYNSWTEAAPFPSSPDYTHPPLAPPPSSSALTYSTPHPFKACIVYLTSLSHLPETLASLHSLALNLPFAQPYPIVLLHTGDCAYPSVQAEFLARWYARADEEGGELAAKMRGMGELVEWEMINLGVPEEMGAGGMESLGEMSKVEWWGRWPGYHSMCRFFATQIFTHPRIGQFDYYMRMDTDSAILTPLTTDPFTRLHTTSSVYAWRWDGTDPEAMVIGLRAYLRNYVAAHPHLGLEDNMRDSGFMQDEGGRGFPGWNNNWEIVHIPSFREGPAGEFARAMSREWQGFYRYRWGDAVIRKAATAMFWPANRTMHLCDFGYHHGRPASSFMRPCA